MRSKDRDREISLSKKGKITVSVICTVLLILLYIAIWGFSGQDADHSGSLSMGITERLVDFFSTITGRNWTEEAIEAFAVYFEHPVRKLAHVLEYSLMSVLVFGIWAPHYQANKKRMLFSILWVFISASVDEFHQVFVPGRYGSFADVLLDTAGGALSLFIVYRITFGGKNGLRSRK